MSHRRRTAGQRTSARILDGALILFNVGGTSSVTTNHIAAHIGISPGNLYYWYADKQEIIRALWARSAAERGAFWEVGDALPTPGEAIAQLAASASVDAAYPFLARELPALVHADAELRAAYTADRERRRAILTALARSWRADGLLQPVDDARLAHLVDAIWVLTEAWFGLADAERLLHALVDPYVVGLEVG